MPSSKTAAPAKVAYFNRELSWLAFNRRVLAQAEDGRYPLLERLKFLSFVASNLDEFYEIRVSGLIQQVESGSTVTGPDGLGPKEQIRRIQSVATALVAEKYACWREQIVPALTQKGLPFKTKEELNKRERAWLRTYFEEQVQPVLTPLALDPAHPFPQFVNKSLNILLWIDDPDTTKLEHMMAFIPVPRILPRVVRIPGAKNQPDAFIFLSDVLKLFAQELFPGYRIAAAHAFRITRNSDLYIDEEEVENLLQSIEAELYNLRKGSAVRLELEEGVEEKLLDELLEAIRLPKHFVFRINGPLNLMRLMSVYDSIDRPDLKFPPFTPYYPPELRPHGDHFIYDTIRQRDQLLHHPFETFDPVVEFVRQAARDPKVLAVKMTLYRTSSDSPIVKALIAAARAGKQVTALIELKARFDEANNINWAKAMEDEGIHVVYGFVGLKTHCKCILIVRREEDGIRRYAHIGTGNYHSKTARLYTDLGLFTSRPDITDEVAEVFNTLTGFAKAPTFKRLLVAPYTLHKGMVALIRRETRNARKGLPARIIVKCNSLLDREITDCLYAASNAGVQIDLIVRGICALVPGIKGMSEHIRVRSILGRYLEHSRIFYFENHGHAPDIFIGSADWMPRNFYRRIEVVTPVDCPHARQRLLEGILHPILRDNLNATILQPNGSYEPRPRGPEEPAFDSQAHFMHESEARAAAEAIAEPSHASTEPDDD